MPFVHRLRMPHSLLGRVPSPHSQVSELATANLALGRDWNWRIAIWFFCS
jgi:hypothetical protein